MAILPDRGRQAASTTAPFMRAPMTSTHYSCRPNSLRQHHTRLDQQRWLVLPVLTALPYCDAEGGVRQRTRHANQAPVPVERHASL